MDLNDRQDAILRQLKERPMGVPEVMDANILPKGEVTKILLQLEEIGLVEQDGDRWKART